MSKLTRSDAGDSRPCKAKKSCHVQFSIAKFHFSVNIVDYPIFYCKKTSDNLLEQSDAEPKLSRLHHSRFPDLENLLRVSALSSHWLLMQAGFN